MKVPVSKCLFCASSARSIQVWKRGWHTSKTPEGWSATFRVQGAQNMILASIAARFLETFPFKTFFLSCLGEYFWRPFFLSFEFSVTFSVFWIVFFVIYLYCFFPFSQVKGSARLGRSRLPPTWVFEVLKSIFRPWRSQKMAGMKQNLNRVWKKWMELVDLVKPTSFLDHVHLGCTHCDCKSNERVVDEQW